MSETTGLQKASILMLALGESEAAEVMKFLGPREVLKLGAAMATMKGIAHEQVVEVLDDFRAQTELNSTVGLDSDEYIRQVLTKALGDDKASVLLSRILGGKDASGIESLKWMDSQSVSELIRNEHPQIIAIVLSHLDADQAAETLKLLPSAPAPTCCCASPRSTASRPTRSTSSTRSWSASSRATRT